MEEEFIEKSGQAMYFDEETAKEMIVRENNISHVLTSKIFEAILLVEFKDKASLVIADLGAGAHTMRYGKFVELLKEQDGEIYWVDQAPPMLSHAVNKTPSKLKEVFNFTQEDMVSFLIKNKADFDGLIFKYSFNYVIDCSLKEWLKLIYESLNPGGKVIANHFSYDKDGMRERSSNAIYYKSSGEKIKSGYKPKDKEIIKVHFLEKRGDQSPNPEVFARTKIIYYSPQRIKEIAYKLGFSTVKIYDDWAKNREWRSLFSKLNPKAKIQSKPFIFLER